MDRMGINSPSRSGLPLIIHFPHAAPSPPRANPGGGCLTLGARQSENERPRQQGDSFPQQRGLGKTWTFVPFGTKMNHRFHPVTRASPKLSQVEPAPASKMSQVGPVSGQEQGERLAPPHSSCHPEHGRGQAGLFSSEPRGARRRKRKRRHDTSHQRGGDHQRTVALGRMLVNSLLVHSLIPVVGAWTGRPPGAFCLLSILQAGKG